MSDAAHKTTPVEPERPVETFEGATLADVTFRAAKPEDVDDGVPTLLREAVGTYNFMWGTDDVDAIEAIYGRLFTHPNNRFSFKHSVVAEAKGRVCGIMVAYPYEVLNKLFWPTTWLILKVLGLWKFIKGILMNYDKLSGKEADRGEYHAYVCGVNKPFRRLGLATMFVFEAERIAKEIGCPKVSCTADPNHKALQAGLALGYEVVDTIKIRGGDSFVRIVKTFDTGDAT